MTVVSLRDIFADPERFRGQEPVLQGWLRNVRIQKHLAFAQMADGSIFDPIQLVFSEDEISDFNKVNDLSVGAAVNVRGELILTPDAKQAFELRVHDFTLVGESPEDYPLQAKRHGAEFLRSIQHLRPRTNLSQAVFRIRSEAAFAIHKFFHERDFIWVHTPIITAMDGEGAGEMFQVTTLDIDNPPRREDLEVDYTEDFFAKMSYLTVTGQLHGEAYAQAFKNIYTFGPTFRSERSHTTRHAAEFWMIEPELAFADLEAIMDNIEAMLKFVIQFIMDRCESELRFLNNFVDKGLLERLETLLRSNFARCTYTKAIEYLEASKEDFKFPVSWGIDLATEHERYLTEEIFKGPVFITDYPVDIKAFYMRRNDDGKTVAATDLLVPGVGELVGGSQREERVDQLAEMIELKGLPAKNYEWYLDLRRYGSTPHGGYGLGFERLIMYLTSVWNIRDVIPFPRTTGSSQF